MLAFENETAADREREFQALLQDPRFHAHLAMRYAGERDVAGRYSELLKQAEAVLAQVREQIED